MHPIELKQNVEKIKMWQKGGQRAPHKPLLLLYALGRLIRGEPRLMFYAEVKDNLKELLKGFGPYRPTYLPSYPFIRLTNDSIWAISGLEPLNTKKDWTDRELIDNQTSGGFSECVYNLLQANQALSRELASDILKKNFPDSLHEDILVQVGLDLEAAGKPFRSPDFRIHVLSAYEYRCAVCGFNVCLGDTLVAEEAAHIKWHQAGGPDSNKMELLSAHCIISSLTAVYLRLAKIWCFRWLENATALMVWKNG